MSEQFPNPHASNEYQEGDEVPTTGAESSPDNERGHEQERYLNPRIYVTKGMPLRAELTDGTWLDMARDPATISAEMYAVLGDTDGHVDVPLYIWDHRDFGAFDVATGAIGLEGVDSIKLLSQVARGIREHGPTFAVWADVHQEDPRLFDHFRNAYKGHYESMAAYVRQQFEPIRLEEAIGGVVPEGLRDFVHVDYEAIGKDMQREGDMIAFPADSRGVWIFDERA